DAWLRCMTAAIAAQPYTEAFAEYLITQLVVPANRVVQASAQRQEQQRSDGES
ncbi:MAG: hemoglobin, partial [Saprospiraceae bacterium]